MRLTRVIATVGSLLLALSTAAPASAAHMSRSDGPVTPQIIGGDYVASAPWAAALYYDGGGFYCSGTIIAPRWVITAQHCIYDGYTMYVRVGNVHHPDGTIARVRRVVRAAGADMALLNLERSVDTTYAPLASSDPPVGRTNHIYGWGTTEVGEDAPLSEWLKVASVRVTSTNSSDYFGGRAVQSRRISGTAGYGDSGGPQFYDGRLVGVCSTGDYVYQTYGSISANRSWIRRVAGV